MVRAAKTAVAKAPAAAPDQIADARNFMRALRHRLIRLLCALMDWQRQDPAAVKSSPVVLRCRVNRIKDEPLLAGGEGTKNEAPQRFQELFRKHRYPTHRRNGERNSFSAQSSQRLGACGCRHGRCRRLEGRSLFATLANF